MTTPLKTLAERLDDEERAMDEDEALSRRITEALERGRKNVEGYRKSRGAAWDPSLDRLVLR